jgi:hypothetical protein
MIVIPKEKKNRKKWLCRWEKCQKYTQPKKQSFCTLCYQLYQLGQANNAAESLTSICNNSGNNEPCDVSAVGNIGGDHAINNNNHDVAVVNNVGDAEIIHDSCGTGPDVNIETWSFSPFTCQQGGDSGAICCNTKGIGDIHYSHGDIPKNG